MLKEKIIFLFLKLFVFLYINLLFCHIQALVIKMDNIEQQNNVSFSKIISTNTNLFLPKFSLEYERKEVPSIYKTPNEKNYFFKIFLYQNGVLYDKDDIKLYVYFQKLKDKDFFGPTTINFYDINKKEMSKERDFFTFIKGECFIFVNISSRIGSTQKFYPKKFFKLKNDDILLKMFFYIITDLQVPNYAKKIIDNVVTSSYELNDINNIKVKNNDKILFGQNNIFLDNNKKNELNIKNIFCLKEVSFKLDEFNAAKTETSSNVNSQQLIDKHRSNFSKDKSEIATQIYDNFDLKHIVPLQVYQPFINQPLIYIRNYRKKF